MVTDSVTDSVTVLEAERPADEWETELPASRVEAWVVVFDSSCQAVLVWLALLLEFAYSELCYSRQKSGIPHERRKSWRIGRCALLLGLDSIRFVVHRQN